MTDRIERIELWHVNVPLAEPFWPSWIPTYARFVTSDGLIGEIAGPAFTTERRGLGDLLGGFMLGLAADDMDGFRKRIREASYLGWRNWWLEAAMWDLAGKAGKPVYKRLQEREQTVSRVGARRASRVSVRTAGIRARRAGRHHATAARQPRRHGRDSTFRRRRASRCTRSARRDSNRRWR